MSVFDEKKCWERLNRERVLDFFDVGFIDAHGCNFDVAVIFRDTDKRRDHHEARRATGR